jgi:hypothetical protein
MFALLSSLDVHERFGSWCESRPMGVYYTLASSKFMENFVTLNVALVAECTVFCITSPILTHPNLIIIYLKCYP